MEWQRLRAQVQEWSDAIQAGTVPDQTQAVIREAYSVSQMALAGKVLADAVRADQEASPYDRPETRRAVVEAMMLWDVLEKHHVPPTSEHH